MHCARSYYLCKKLSSGSTSNRLLSVTKSAVSKSSSHFHHHHHHHAPLASCSLLSLSSPPGTGLQQHVFSGRSLSTRTDGNDGSSGSKPPSGSRSGEDDKNFFLQNDEDSLPTPPSYVRDAVTGKWTDKTQAELSLEDRKLLKLDDESRTMALMSRLETQWDAAAAANHEHDKDGFGTLHAEQKRVAHRIQEEQLALGTIGRDPSSLIGSNITKSEDDNNHKGNPKDDEQPQQQPLSSREFQALKNYAAKEHNIHPKDFASLTVNDPDLIPHHNSISSGRAEGNTDSKQFYDADLDLAHLNPKLNKLAFSDDNVDHYDPFADLLPSDFNPTRKVNRKHAKLLPTRLLHHNNLSLLRRYTTPGGKIMNRVQSRLGVKDQRKIAKLVKRARHLGLIPHIGQWKFEDHGNLHERGLNDAEADSVGGGEGKRDWEVELEKRGLWPLADENELVKRFYDIDGILDHLAGPMDGNKRKELEDLLTGGDGTGTAKSSQN
jgi:ribosomal protein S18